MKKTYFITLISLILFVQSSFSQKNEEIINCYKKVQLEQENLIDFKRQIIKVFKSQNYKLFKSFFLTPKEKIEFSKKGYIRENDFQTCTKEYFESLKQKLKAKIGEEIEFPKIIFSELSETFDNNRIHTDYTKTILTQKTNIRILYKGKFIRFAEASFIKIGSNYTIIFIDD